MKRSLFFALVILICSFAYSQNELIVQKNSAGLYLEHTVTPKQNFYSIGRLYNISPKEIASFNALDMNKGLHIGQIIKIPLTHSNFSQTTSSGRPVYYVIPENEGLFGVSTKNNLVLMANLRKWNNLTDDHLKPGEKLIVGYLNSQQANKIIASNTGSISQAPQVIEPPLKENKNAETAPVETVIKKEPAKMVTEPLPKREESPITKSNAIQTSSNTSIKNTNGAGGYFHSQFDQQTKMQPLKADQTATAGIFKTSSGWQDAKYYALMDNIDPGTIIRIVNPTNNKSVYAKVLGTMSGVRQNQGYDIRISNAAASALDISETDKFIVRVLY
ncbi:MAG TPA: LysM peptidoglycan-binding domain-containing protein [Flavisolibacter sp.]|jgi:hypothetical protein|nr:LysM peptidoglycan-binding domain-containing protein [Flavisolibacter sp.]